MRAFLSCLFFLSFVFLEPCLLSAESDEKIRKWSEKETGRSIEGELVEKRADGSAIKIKSKDGRMLWIDTETLSREDLEFVKVWVAPGDHLTCRVIASGRGWKEVKVTAKAGTSPVEVVAFRVWENKRKPIVKKLEKGQTVTFTYKAHNEYRVQVKAKKKIREEETYRSKVGL